MTSLVDAHIEAQRRLRGHVTASIAQAWDQLPAYNEENVSPFQALVLPAVAAAQRASVAVTNAFVARAGHRQPLALNSADLVGAGVRAGTPPSTVYRRPFVAVWTALAASTPYAGAVAAGRARAVAAGAMDVQLSMRATLNAIGDADPGLLGYERVPDGDACDFCVQAAGERYASGDLMPIHNNCGCGVDPIYADEPSPRVDQPEVPPDAPPVGVAEHGELGLVLVNADDHFTQL